MSAKPLPHRGPDFRPSFYDIGQSQPYQAYIKAGHWRCSESETGGHQSVYDKQRRVFVCRRCGIERPAQLWMEDNGG